MDSLHHWWDVGRLLGRTTLYSQEVASMRYKLLGMLVGFLSMGIVLADTSTSTTTLTIAPSATSGDTIRSADENDRSGDVSTWGNAHVHSLSNTTEVGDGASGNKALCANAADATDACLRWDDTADLWVVNSPVPASYNQLLVASGTASLTTDALLTSASANTVDDLITLAGTRPSTYGDVSARAFNTAAFALTSGTAAVITLDSERWDTDTIHSTASNTSRLTATTAGKYQITGHVEFASGPTTGVRRLEILLNGATVIASQDCPFNTATPSDAVRCSITTHYNLSATDYVELRANQTASATLNVNASGNYSPEFEMVKVP